MPDSTSNSFYSTAPIDVHAKCRARPRVLCFLWCEILLEFQKNSKLQGGRRYNKLGLWYLPDSWGAKGCAVVVYDLLQSSVDLLSSRRIMVEEMEDDSLHDELRPLVASARRWCAILCDTLSQGSQMWSCAVGVAACRVAKILTNHDGYRYQRFYCHSVIDIYLLRVEPMLRLHFRFPSHYK